MYVLRLVTDFLIEVRGLVHGLSILEGETYERFEETKKGGLLNRGHSTATWTQFYPILHS
jgi:hypothetical protein